MAELSKTAKQSMVREVKEVRVETPEESIRQLRLNLAAGLYVTPDRIKVLLAAYDQVREQVLESSWTTTLEEGKSYRITRVHDEISVESIEEGTQKFLSPAIIEQMIEPSPGQSFEAGVAMVLTPERLAMASIPAQEEDPHHLVDFGHHTVHTEAAGA